MQERTFQSGRVLLIGMRSFFCSLSLGLAISWVHSQPVLSTPPLSPVAGQRLNVPVQLSGGQNIVEFTFHLNYDGNALSLPDMCANRVTTGEVVTDVIASCAVENKIIVSLVCFGPNGCASATGDPVTLVEIEFDALGVLDCGLFFSDLFPVVQKENGACGPGDPPILSIVGLSGSEAAKELNNSAQLVFGVHQPRDERDEWNLNITFDLRLDRPVDRHVCVGWEVQKGGIFLGLTEALISAGRTEASIDLIASGRGFAVLKLVVKSSSSCILFGGPFTEAIVAQPNEVLIRPVDLKSCFVIAFSLFLCSSGLPGFSICEGLGLAPTTAPVDGLATLRSFRNEIMIPSPTGRFYVDLFERMNLNLALALFMPSALSDQVLRESASWLEGFHSILHGQGDSFLITQEMVDGLLGILAGFKEDGNEELRQALQLEEDRLALNTLAGLSMDEFLDRITVQGGKLYELNFAQFADGQGLFSQIILFSLDEAMETPATLTLKDDDGQPLTVDLNGEDVEGTLDVTIPASGLIQLKTDSVGDLVVGSVSVTSENPVAGVILFGGSVGLAGVGNSLDLSDGFTAPMEVVIDADGTTRLVDTGIAVMNLEIEAVDLTLMLLDADGNEVATTTVSLEGMGHLARFLSRFTDWDPEITLADLADFRGTLMVTSTGRIAATVIQSRPRQFATMPVEPK